MEMDKSKSLMAALSNFKNGIASAADVEVREKPGDVKEDIEIVSKAFFAIKYFRMMLHGDKEYSSEDLEWTQKLLEVEQGLLKVHGNLQRRTNYGRRIESLEKETKALREYMLSLPPEMSEDEDEEMQVEGKAPVLLTPTSSCTTTLITQTPKNKKKRSPKRKKTKLVEKRKEQRKHECLLCGWAFFRKGDLENHIRSHTGERPFSCSLCRKTFSRDGTRKAHEIKCIARNNQSQK